MRRRHEIRNSEAAAFYIGLDHVGMIVDHIDAQVMCVWFL